MLNLRESHAKSQRFSMWPHAIQLKCISLCWSPSPPPPKKTWSTRWCLWLHGTLADQSVAADICSPTEGAVSPWLSRWKCSAALLEFYGILAPWWTQIYMCTNVLRGTTTAHSTNNWLVWNHCIRCKVIQGQLRVALSVGKMLGINNLRGWTHCE